MQKPQSRNEAILQSMIADTEYTDPPQSRIEALLLKLKEVIEAGGGEIVVDDEISTTSTHPVQNRVIAANLLPAIAGITPNSSGSMELDREDLNDFTTSGIYNAMNCENAPFNDMALVILGYSMDGYCVQIACDVASGNFKFRNQIDGNWTAWGDNILSTLEAHTAAINELENNTKSIQTATGNPITIQASESNLVECKAEVEAVQDLHGYDHPWVGGAGKNKLPLTVANLKSFNTTGTWVGNTYTHANVAFTILTDSDDNVIGFNINGTANDTALFFLGLSVQESENVILNGGISNDIIIVSRYTTTPYEWASSVGGDADVEMSRPRAFYIQVNNGVAVSNQKCYPMARLASISDSTFAPYSNISPITGQTEVVIEDVGKNKFDTSTCVLNKYIDDDGTIKNADGYMYSQPIHVKDGSYKFSGLYSGSGVYTVRIIGYDKDDNFVSLLGRQGHSASERVINVDATVTSEIKFVRISLPQATNDPQLELGSTATPYEPYQGKTYTIQIGQTVYGAHWNNKGQLVVDTAEVDLGSLTWNHDGNMFYSHTGLPTKRYTATETQNVISSLYKGYSWVAFQDVTYGMAFQNNSAVLRIKDTRYTDATAFKTAVTGQTLVYELATPYTIQLTPEQIRLLKGTNNISCNTGNLSIKYYPDNVLGQLKGDIEDEYDDRVVNLEEKANNALKIKSITTNTGTNQQGVSSSSYDNYVQGDKKLIPLSITAKTPGYEVVDVHYVLDEINRLIYFIPKDLTGSAIPSGRTVSMTIYYFEI